MKVAGHALVVLGVRDVVETVARHLLHADALRVRAVEDLAEPRFRSYTHRDDQLARPAAGAQRFEHWVAAVEDVHRARARLRRVSSADRPACPRR